MAEVEPESPTDSVEEFTNPQDRAKPVPPDNPKRKFNEGTPNKPDAAKRLRLNINKVREQYQYPALLPGEDIRVLKVQKGSHDDGMLFIISRTSATSGIVFLRFTLRKSGLNIKYPFFKAVSSILLHQCFTRFET